jgi:hypothetical protein
MTVGHLLDKTREAYIVQFRKSISEVRNSGLKAVAEPACRNENGFLVKEGELNLPMRLDCVGLKNGEAKDRFRIDSNSLISFEPVDFFWSDSLPVRLAPFRWDSCRVRVAGICKTEDWTNLFGWFDKWFDGDDNRPADENGLSGVIHFISDPKREDVATIFEVDFGSAPVEAFEELLDAFQASGAKKIEIF